MGNADVKAITKTRPGFGVTVTDIDRPKVGPEDILVKVHAASLCGSDLHIYEWTAGYEWIKMPVVLGHEFAGEVVETGAHVASVKPGDRICCLPSYACGGCVNCQQGRPAACMRKFGLGMRTDGTFSEYMLLRATADIVRIPDDVPYDVAALTEPLAVGLQGIDLSGIRPGQTAAVFGPGPIGLLMVQLLKAAGAGRIVVTGTRSDMERLRIAKQLGADLIVNVEDGDPVATVIEQVGPLDFVFEATGVPQTIQQALSMIRRGGKVMVMGIHADLAKVDITALVRGQKSIVGVYGYSADTFRRCLALMAGGKVDVAPIITHRIPFSQGEKGFELALSKAAAKVVFVPDS